MRFYRIASVWFIVFFAVFALNARAGVNDANNTIAVTINGTNLTEGELQKLMEPHLEALSSQVPAQFLERAKKQLWQKVLEQTIIEAILDEKVKEAGITITEQDVIKHLEELASRQNPPMSLEQFKQLLEAYGQSFDEIKQRAKKGVAYKKILEAQWAGTINFTEEDAQKYYSDNPGEFQVKEQVKASHILIKPDTSETAIDEDEAKAQAKAKTEKLLKQIKEGADFAELAKANSDCPSSTNGGDLGYFEKGRMVPPFEKAAFALKPGLVSDIVETRFGYHIIKVVDHQDGSTTSFEEAKDSIIEKLTQEKQSKITQQYIESLKAEADIVYPPGKEPQPAGMGTLIPPVK
ncbi:peptidylprolyl isomerase [Planctomycetota bacterium]